MTYVSIRMQTGQHMSYGSGMSLCDACNPTQGQAELGTSILTSRFVKLLFAIWKSNAQQDQLPSSCFLQVVLLLRGADSAALWTIPRGNWYAPFAARDIEQRTRNLIVMAVALLAHLSKVASAAVPPAKLIYLHVSRNSFVLSNEH